MNELPNRQKEMDSRHIDDMTWREKIRAEDRAERDALASQN